MNRIKSIILTITLTIMSLLYMSVDIKADDLLNTIFYINMINQSADIQKIKNDMQNQNLVKYREKYANITGSKLDRYTFDPNNYIDDATKNKIDTLNKKFEKTKEKFNIIVIAVDGFEVLPKNIVNIIDGKSSSSFINSFNLKSKSTLVIFIENRNMLNTNYSVKEQNDNRLFFAGTKDMEYLLYDSENVIEESSEYIKTMTTNQTLNKLLDELELKLDKTANMDKKQLLKIKSQINDEKVRKQRISLGILIFIFLIILFLAV